MIDPGTFATTGVSERPVVHEVVVAAPPSEVFRVLSSSDGVSAYLGVPAKVELAIGGAYELMFAPDLPPGQQGSEGCQILAYVPDEMLAFSWNAPPTLAEIRGKHTWVVITLTTPGNERTTQVRLVHTGFGQGAIWDEDRAYFERAWSSVLAALQDHFAG